MSGWIAWPVLVAVEIAVGLVSMSAAAWVVGALLLLNDRRKRADTTEGER